MAEMSLAKALKCRNRLIERIRKAERDIRAHNSITKGAVRPVSTIALFALRDALVDGLVELKTKVALANAPIQKDIFRLSELKTEINFCREIDVRHGIRQVEQWGADTSNTIEYEAEVGKVLIDGRIDRLVREVDAIQDGLDEYNHKAKIQITPM